MYRSTARLGALFLALLTASPAPVKASDVGRLPILAVPSYPPAAEVTATPQFCLICTAWSNDAGNDHSNG